MGTKISIVENFLKFIIKHFIIFEKQNNKLKNKLIFDLTIYKYTIKSNTNKENIIRFILGFVLMIHPQVHLRIPCYDFSFL